MNQGALGVKEFIQGKQSKHCLVDVEEGSYYPGGGLAHFKLNYSKSLCIMHLFIKLCCGIASLQI